MPQLLTLQRNMLALAAWIIAVGCCAGITRAATSVSISGTLWRINGKVTNPGTACEGRLMNVRMVNATFEDRTRPDFDPESNAQELLTQLEAYRNAGINAITLCLQGGMPGYEGATNSAFREDGTLDNDYLSRVERLILGCDKQGMAVILTLFYQRQSGVLRDDDAIRRGVVNAARWIQEQRFANVLLEIANEYPHSGFAHGLIRDPAGQASLVTLAKNSAPQLLVSTSGIGHGRLDAPVAEACDYLTVHWNGVDIDDIPCLVEQLKKYNKPIVCNEDDRTGTNAVRAMKATIGAGTSYGLMLKDINQKFPFSFRGLDDDPEYYAALAAVTEPYFPPPESQGGWRTLDNDADVRQVAGMDPQKLSALRDWLLASDNRNFAGVVIRHGFIALQVERGNDAATDARRVASVSKAICATVLAIASERSQHGQTPRAMTFDDRAFEFIPWAQPLSDPRKADITVKQLLNYTSGICPEATGAPNSGSWEYILGHTDDVRTAQLAFAPGDGCGYSTHALSHASLVCENVTGIPYDEFAIEALFRPIGVEHWTFEYFNGGDRYGRHASHGLGMPARDLARIAYCMLHDGRWKDQQVIPTWFVDETATPTHHVTSPEMRWKLNPAVFSHAWELPARHDPQSGRDGKGIPADARSKPGSGGQIMAFVPSLDLVVTRQNGSSGDWQFEEFVRRACDAVVK